MHFFKILLLRWLLLKMVASGSSYFADFGKVKIFSIYFADFDKSKFLVVILLTLNKSKFLVVILLTLNNNYRFMTYYR